MSIESISRNDLRNALCPLNFQTRRKSLHFRSFITRPPSQLFRPSFSFVWKTLAPDNPAKDFFCNSIAELIGYTNLSESYVLSCFQSFQSKREHGGTMNIWVSAFPPVTMTHNNNVVSGCERTGWDSANVIITVKRQTVKVVFIISRTAGSLRNIRETPGRFRRGVSELCRSR